MDRLEQEVFPYVEKPARYTGGEHNSVVKDWEGVSLRFALAFPDIYDIGMGHLGSKILYWMINERKDSLCERVYAPWVDMEQLLRQKGLPLFSLESRRPLSEFDLVGFTLQYELSYTNILNMLDLARIPLKAADREESDPFIVGGGPCAYNPEPVADFFDFFFIGEAEAGINDVLDLFVDWKASGAGREEFLRRISQLPGIYVPSFYDVHYHDDGRISEVVPNRPEASEVVHKRVVQDLESADYPEKFIVPYIDVVHDRAMVEVLRGCTRGCRFCQAGMIYRPVRERSPQLLLKQIENLLASTGYEEVSLTSLSTGDYSQIEELVDELISRLSDTDVAVSLPSLRVDSFSVNLADRIQRARKTGLTFAPEAGTQRLRDVINKNVTEENLYEAVRSAFEAGWDSVKLYFMIGLPTETDEDVRGIASLARQVAGIGQELRGKKGKAKRVKVTVSTASFVPKAHTPFQWEPQMSRGELLRRQRLLQEELKSRAIVYNWHDVQTSFLEAILARGDRRVAAAIENAWRRGCKLDGWSEHFRFEQWMQAFQDTGLNPEFYASRRRNYDEVFPWDHISAGVTRAFLQAEHKRALRAEPMPDCRGEDCPACGVCFDLQVRPLVGERHAD